MSKQYENIKKNIIFFKILLKYKNEQFFNIKSYQLNGLLGTKIFHHENGHSHS
jgi:hypothetical protein